MVYLNLVSKPVHLRVRALRLMIAEMRTDNTHNCVEVI